MKRTQLKRSQISNTSHFVSPNHHAPLTTALLLIGTSLSACSDHDVSASESTDLSAHEALIINSHDDTETGSEPTSEPISDSTASDFTTCELACAELVECLTSQCGELDAESESQLSQRCLTTCTPQQAEIITTQSCEENIAQLSERQEPIANACAMTGVGSVFNDQTFDVDVTEDVVFAQGLTHSDWSGADGVPMDLVLDVYKPIRENPPKMPVVVLIHGGGFKGGTHKKPEFIEMAHSFAARGWVVFSIDYRVVPNFGTLPREYPEPPTDDLTQMQYNQWKAFYPACRDAKAAIRWIRAQADEYSLDTDYITAIGGSAGSAIALALGVTQEDDCVSEVSVEDDATLATTHLEQSSSVHTVIDHWGGVGIVRMLELLTPGDRFDNTDAPISIIHGTEDPAVPFTQAEEIKAEYDRTGVEYAWYPLEGLGHGPWEVEIGGKSLTDLAFDFIVEQQGLEVE